MTFRFTLTALGFLGLTACNGVLDLESPTRATPTSADPTQGSPDSQTTPTPATPGNPSNPASSSTGTATCAGADVTTDAHNCGACAHECGRGSTCAAGSCTASDFIVDRENAPIFLLPTTQGFFWRSEVGKSVNRCLDDDCLTHNVLRGQLDTYPNLFALTGGATVAFQSVFSDAKKATMLVDSAHPLNAPREVPGVLTAKGDNGVVVVDGATTSLCTAANCTPLSVRTTPSLLGMYVGSDRYYQLTPATTGGGSGLTSCPLAGCATAPSAPATTLFALYNDSLQFFPGGVVWVGVSTSGHANAIHACTLPDCLDDRIVVDETAAAVNGTGGLTVQGSHVYFLTNASLYRCPLSGCSTPELLVTNEVNPRSLVSDAKHAYWLSGDSTVRRVAIF